MFLVSYHLCKTIYRTINNERDQNMPTVRDMKDHITFCPQPNRLLDRGVEGEQRTASYLYDHLISQNPGDYRILVNYNFPQRGNNTLEIDLLVINTFGLFLLEVKNWVGTIKAYDDGWVYNNGENRENVFAINSNKSKVIHSYLSKSAIPTLSFKPRNISVTSLIVLARGTQKFQNMSHHDVQGVVGIDESLTHALTSTDLLHYGQRSPRLNNQDIKLIYNTLFHSHQSNNEEIVGDYRLLRKVRHSTLFEEFESQNIHVASQYVRLKAYRLNILANERVTERTITQFKRDLEVVNSLGYHPNIVWTIQFFPDPRYYGLYYEVTEPINGPRLDEYIAQRRSEQHAFSFAEQITILDALCQALQHAHNHTPTPIYHRNISTETVFITRNDRTQREVIKLADFDFAKFGVHTINPMRPGHPLVNTIFTAPEVLRNASDARAYSDIYALGILWLFLALVPHHTLPTTFTHQNTHEYVALLQLPDPARVLLQRMTTFESTQRPQTIEEVIAILQRLPV
jgi:hypothetical protein